MDNAYARGVISTTESTGTANPALFSARIVNSAATTPSTPLQPTVPPPTSSPARPARTATSSKEESARHAP